MIRKKCYFGIFEQNIDCGYMLEPPQLRPPRWGGSNEYPQCMFWIKNKKITCRCISANPSFVIHNGFKGIYILRTCFLDVKLIE